jgi:hypothetical protein
LSGVRRAERGTYRSRAMSTSAAGERRLTRRPAAAAYPVQREAALLIASFAAAVATTLLTHRFYLDPFSALGQWLPLALGLAVAVGVTIAYLTHGPDRAVVLGFVFVPAWIAFFLAGQLHGTPYDYGGIHYDIGRVSALATRFTVSTSSSDQFIRGLPSEYPPLFPLLIGKTAVLLDIPAWQLVGRFSVIAVAVSVPLSFVLWRRVTHAPMALALSLVSVAVYGEPRKAFEVVAAAVTVPWILATFASGTNSPSALHWISAGIIGGLLVSDYPAFLVFSAAGIVVLMALEARRTASGPYVRHVLLTTVTAFAVAAWFVVPWAMWVLRHATENVADLYHGLALARDLWHLPWQQEPVAAVLLTLGLGALIAGARHNHLVRCLLVIAVSLMAYRWLNVVRYENTGHTGFLVKTGRLSDAVLVSGLLLGAAAVWERLKPRAQHLTTAVPAAGLGLIMAASLTAFWHVHRLGASTTPPSANYGRLAHATPSPDGRYLPYRVESQLHVPPFPADRVRAAIESVLGDGALPVTLSYSEVLSAYYPIYEYLGVSRYASSSLVLLPQRRAEVATLVGVRDPQAFAVRSADTRFGPIDAFVLAKRGRRLGWGSSFGFREAQFDSGVFARFDLPGGTVVFVRRNATVDHADYPR